MKKKVLIIGGKDPSLGKTLAEEIAKLRILDNNKTRIMDIELREILNKVYRQEMRPDEAQWKILRLLIVVGALAEQLCPKCGSDNIEPSDKENDNECNYCGFIWA